MPPGVSTKCGWVNDDYRIQFGSGSRDPKRIRSMMGSDPRVDPIEEEIDPRVDPVENEIGSERKSDPRVDPIL